MKVCFFCSLFVIVIEFRKLVYVLSWFKLSYFFSSIFKIIYNRETDQSRGFGFVTMSTVDEAERAIEKFHRYVCYFCSCY